MRGMYIHIPFCLSKCEYCDFYSMKLSNSLADDYVDAVCAALYKIDDTVDTVYFGGGTPSCIGSRRIAEILHHINYSDDAEITVECNPKTAAKAFLRDIFAAGANRISIGLQSADDNELKLLTRTHKAADVLRAVNDAKSVGFKNISLDIMLGIESQTVSSVRNTVRFCADAGVTHISAYMLKIEQNTPFARRDLSAFPDDDTVADMYDAAVNELEKHGFTRYEISNFAKDGCASKHNLKYWHSDEYYGIGPAAHSFINGKRYFYPRDIDYFLSGGEPIFNSDFGGFNEYAMLALRLREGLKFDKMKDKGIAMPDDFLSKCAPLEQAGYLQIDKNGVSLTSRGFAVQNAILCEIL